MDYAKCKWNENIQDYCCMNEDKEILSAWLNFESE